MAAANPTPLLGAGDFKTNGAGRKCEYWRLLVAVKCFACQTSCTA